MTVFFRVLANSVDEKPNALLRGVQAVFRAGEIESLRPAVFEVVPGDFQAVSGSPFAYWLSDNLRSLFRRLPAFGSTERLARNGLSTFDDFRWLRLWWEGIGAGAREPYLVPFAKGGRLSPYYSDLVWSVRWGADGRWIKEWKQNQLRLGNITANNSKCWSESLYRKAGLTWPLRTSRFAPAPLPEGCIFSVRGYSAFVPNEELPATLAIFNSAAFDYLFKVALGRHGHPEFVVGILERVPWPQLSEDVANKLHLLACRAWSLLRSVDTTNEISHAFLLPSDLNEKVTRLDRSAVERELRSIQTQIDDLTFSLYGIGADDRATIEASAKAAASDSDDVEAERSDDADEAGAETTVGSGPDALSSWLVGVTFGRFDPRLATGERAIPPEPDPFAPLPSRSSGMYPAGEEPADRPDILVDDEGHADDLAARALAIAERVRVEPENLRGWLAKEFFPLHIKMYSRSRRKAPIYWQLATPSASYSVWLYIHAFNKDTLFRVQNDYIGGERGKLAHEERRLESLASELRGGATAAQRKQLAAQEALVEELRAFLDEVKRVAPLWKPNLDDGVIINFAPLWRLVPQNKAWQKELKSTWDALADGEYDWAHVAMHFWPERVAPKCAKDRSLAIAHGLEDMFWVEGSDGKWTARKTPTKSVEHLVKERTSPAVKSALKSLLEAAVDSGKSTGHGRGSGRRKGAAAVEKDT